MKWLIIDTNVSSIWFWWNLIFKRVIWEVAEHKPNLWPQHASNCIKTTVSIFTTKSVYLSWECHVSDFTIIWSCMIPQISQVCKAHNFSTLKRDRSRFQIPKFLIKRIIPAPHSMFNFSLAICALFLILFLRFSKDRRYMRLKYKIAAADIGQMRKTPEMFWNNGTLGVIYTHLCHPYQGIFSQPFSVENKRVIKNMSDHFN